MDIGPYISRGEYPVGKAPGVSAEEFGAGVGKEMGALAEVVQAADDKAAEIARTGEFYAIRRRIVEGVGLLDTDLSTNPDHRTHYKRAEEGFGKILEGAAKGVTDPLLKAKLDEYGSAYRDRYLLDARHVERALAVDYGKVESRKTVDAFVLAGDVDGVDSTLAEGAATGIWTREEAAAHRSDSYLGIAQEKIARGDALGARAFLESDRAKAALDQKDRAAALAKIAPVEAAQLGLTVARGLKRDNPKATLAELDGMAYRALVEAGGRPEAYEHATRDLAAQFKREDDTRKDVADEAERKVYATIAEKVRKGEPISMADVPPEDYAALLAVAPDKARGVEETIRVRDNREEADALEVVLVEIAKAEREGRVPKRGDVPAEAWDRLLAVAPDKADIVLDELRAEGHADEDRRRLASDRAREAANRPGNGQRITWAGLKQSPEALLKSNLDKLLAGGKITGPQYDDLVTDKVALQNPAKRAKKESTILTDKTAVDTILAGAGIDDKKDPTRYAHYIEYIEGRKAALGGEVDQATLREIARDAIRVEKQQGGWWGKKAMRAEADPERVVVPPITPRERQRIVEALKSRGMAADEASIQALYEKGYRSRMGGGKR